MKDVIEWSLKFTLIMLIEHQKIVVRLWPRLNDFDLGVVCYLELLVCLVRIYTEWH